MERQLLEGFAVLRIGKLGLAFFADETTSFGAGGGTHFIDHAAMCAGCRRFGVNSLSLSLIGRGGLHRRLPFQSGGEDEAHDTGTSF
jgi:hypothetical protein